jgi:hypothetical protein
MTTTQQSAARELAVRLANVLHEYLAGRVVPEDVPARLRKIADWVEAGSKGRKPKSESVAAQFGAEVVEVYGYWLRATARSTSAARLTDERKRHVLARLNEGYTVEQIKRAIDGVAASPFHKGDNDSNRRYDDLIIICRNATQLERYIELCPIAVTGAATPSQEREQTDLTKIRSLAKDALRAGNNAEYQRLNEQLKLLSGNR